MGLNATPKLLVIGNGLVGSNLATFDGVDVVSHREALGIPIDAYDAVINCAGIAGDAVCKEAGRVAVMEANVWFSIRLSERCAEKGIPFIQLSTTGVYKPQVCLDLDGWVYPNEESPTAAYNLYIESKIEMEKLLKDCYIFRMAWFYDEENFRRKASQWTHVQDTYTSFITPNFLYKIIRRVAVSDALRGIYNVASGIVYFPELVEMLGLHLRKRREYPSTMTAAVPVSDAKIAGILYNPIEYVTL